MLETTVNPSHFYDINDPADKQFLLEWMESKKEGGTRLLNICPSPQLLDGQFVMANGKLIVSYPIHRKLVDICRK